MSRLRLLTAGESHGPALVTILEGLPHGLTVEKAAIDEDLKRRQGGYGRGGRMKIEKDQVEVLSGPPDPAKLSPPELRKVYDTTKSGRGNGGHTFGDHLSDAERMAVIEYLKTL